MADFDYLGLEPLLQARLQEQVPQVAAIYTAETAASLSKQAQKHPSLHILYLGDNQIYDEAGVILDVEQRWGVILAVKHLASSEAQRRQAGPILTETIRALFRGWKPGPDYRKLIRITAPPPIYDDGGWAYFPIYFTSRLTAGWS